MIVIFVCRHWLLPAFFPDAAVIAELAKGPCHLSYMNCNRSTARTNVVDPNLLGARGVIAHVFARELQRIKSQRKLRQAGEIRLFLRRTIAYGLTCKISVNSFSHFFHRPQQMLRRTQTVHAHDVRASV